MHSSVNLGMFTAHRLSTEGGPGSTACLFAVATVEDALLPDSSSEIFELSVQKAPIMLFSCMDGDSIDFFLTTRV